MTLTKEQGILIGDYRIIQSENGPIRRAGAMETPLLEDSIEKQAF